LRRLLSNDEPLPENIRHLLAVAMGRRGGLKGGKARAKSSLLKSAQKLLSWRHKRGGQRTRKSKLMAKKKTPSHPSNGNNGAGEAKTLDPITELDSQISETLSEISLLRGGAKILPLFLDRASINVKTVDDVFDDLRANMKVCLLLNAQD
jgi:hypothetical protein